MRWLGVTALGLVACVQTNTVVCEDGRTCPSGTVCRTVTDPLVQMCADLEQVAACEGEPGGTLCATRLIPDGRCYDGVCLSAGCGNGRVDPGELCDDGNTTVGDGCSFECRSNETCGNGIVDPIHIDGMGAVLASETCDDANVLGHDGCSGSCALEAPLWEQLMYAPTPAGVAASMVYDSARDRVVMYGGFAFPRLGAPLPSQSFDTTYEWDGTAWERITSTLAPPARAHAAMAYDAARRRTVLFGGASANVLGDTWEWDGTSWKPIFVPGPPPRARHVMAYDSIRKKVVMLGGDNGLGRLWDDVWEYDGTWTKSEIPAPPAPRSGAIAVFDPARGVIVVAGGDTGSGTGDTCEFDGASWRHLPAATPASMTGAAAAFDPGSRTVITYGGANYAAEAYSWDGATWKAIDNSPTGRTDGSMAIDAARGQVVMFGGTYDAGFCLSCAPNLSDTWLFKSGAWSYVDELAQATPILERQASAFDPLSGRLIEFGGMTSPTGPDSGTTWALSHGKWVMVSTTGPSARHDAAMAYDAARTEIVLFGGDDGTPQADTWLFDGNGWSNPTPAHQPPARAQHGMAYDPTSQRVVMYGGCGDTQTWEWDGTDWTPHATTGLGELIAPTLAYDATLGQVLMYGGRPCVGTMGSDTTWAWNPATATWTALAPLTTPGPRTTTLAPLPARHTLVAFDGQFVFPYDDAPTLATLDETWEWNGVLWQQIAVAGRPPERAGHVIAPLADGSGILIHGGEREGTPAETLGDAWRLRWVSATPYENCATTVDIDGDGLGGCADPDCWFACAPLCPPGATCDGSAPRCGDGACNTAIENCRICSSDCGACTAQCGDSFCDPAETSATCPGDCWGQTPSLTVTVH